MHFFACISGPFTLRALSWALCTFLHVFQVHSPVIGSDKHAWGMWARHLDPTLTPVSMILQIRALDGSILVPWGCQPWHFTTHKNDASIRILSCFSLQSLSVPRGMLTRIRTSHLLLAGHLTHGSFPLPVSSSCMTIAHWVRSKGSCRRPGLDTSVFGVYSTRGG